MSLKILTNSLLKNRRKKITKAICTHSLFFTKSFVLSFCKSRVEVSCQNQTFSEKFPPLRRKTTSLFLTSGKFFEYIRIHNYHTFGLCGKKYLFRLKPKAIIAGPPKTQQSKNFIFIFSLIILM